MVVQWLVAEGCLQCGMCMVSLCLFVFFMSLPIYVSLKMMIVNQYPFQKEKKKDSKHKPQTSSLVLVSLQQFVM